ncbi:YibE/F family protein [Petroclostridium sp. X23]|uniref:YibE/F family protein n=1 Tax=Petroclostridium sp. X23 TaxID=3045146 RepID=UPI0024AE3A26|nr:YibE/F family protein [Petroclostridium sp. X23]WHH60223.1 YibE/F family protein [Petroclostridium sp. X23]
MKKILSLCIMIIIITTSSNAEVVKQDSSNMVKVKIVQVDNLKENEIEKQEITAEILTGQFRGEHVDVRRTITKYSVFDFKLRENSEIYVQLNIDDGKILSASFTRVSREKSMVLLTISFITILILFGMGKGITSSISLLFSGFMIIKVFIPMIIQGYDPVFSAICVSAVVIFISFLLISGPTKKSAVAIIGTLAGTIAAGLIAAYFSEISYISGITDDHTQFLITELGLEIDFKGLLFAGIIIGTMGAVMDVSMSIASVLEEIKKQNGNISFVNMVASGLNVGKDMMATMVNTLVLAYAGASMPMFVLFSCMQYTSTDIINLEVIAVEIIRSLCGSIGLILTVPFTSIVAAYIFRNSYQRKRSNTRSYRNI